MQARARVARKALPEGAQEAAPQRPRGSGREASGAQAACAGPGLHWPCSCASEQQCWPATWPLRQPCGIEGPPLELAQPLGAPALAAASFCRFSYLLRCDPQMMMPAISAGGVIACESAMADWSFVGKVAAGRLGGNRQGAALNRVASQHSLQQPAIKSLRARMASLSTASSANQLWR